MHFSGNRESTMVQKMFFDPSQPRFQMILDVIAMAVVILAQTVVAVILNNFTDNYLCLLYSLKLIIAAGCYWFGNIFADNFSKKLYVVRGVYDLIQFGVGYVLLRYLNLHLECYIILCAVLVLELSASTICVFTLTPKNKKKVKTGGDIENSAMTQEEETLTSPLS